MLDTWVATTDLEIASASYERQVSELVDADEETSTYVSSLEEAHDAEPGIVPSAETIAEEVERFLRAQSLASAAPAATRGAWRGQGEVCSPIRARRRHGRAACRARVGQYV